MQFAVIALESGEAAVAASRDVLEEDALDGILCAVGEDLLRRRLDQARAHVECTLGFRHANPRTCEPG